MIKITLELTERQYGQLVHSLENDWVDNDLANKGVITNILYKLRQAIKKEA